MTWQEIVVAVVVGACALYIARRWYGVIAGKSTGCGCGDACPSKHTVSTLLFNPKSKIQNPK
jgi:hypothetical protein